MTCPYHDSRLMEPIDGVSYRFVSITMTFWNRATRVVARREVIGRVGAALSPEEEAARARLHELTSQLAAPPLYNGRLNELLCAVRLQRSASAGASHERYHLDPGAQEDVKQFLSLQQKGMAHLLDTARKDLAALGIIAEGMSRLVRA
ncbi:unnamed protein product [Chrysodeixis includens]|uniref:Uncharacterized protein n=1 Tax=Chrysodeixis includens TaxID=689277 RepID=A0A9N8KSJ9_CHRIL|nr:unnamed protein product [Chrysodeixis includens]